MSEITTQARPKWFTPLAWVAFVWNLLGQGSVLEGDDAHQRLSRVLGR